MADDQRDEQPYEDLLLERDDPVLTIVLNRPDKANALSHRLRGELAHALGRAEADPRTRVIVIRGAGNNFSAGYDLADPVPGHYNMIGGPSPHEPPLDEDGNPRTAALPHVGPAHPGVGQWAQHLVSFYQLIWDLTKPVIAQVHGNCLAGGSELASMCDLMFVADDAVLGYPAVRGLSSPDILFHPWHMPMRKVRELLYSGDPLSGIQAVEVGWANHAYPIEELTDATKAFAHRMGLIEADQLAMLKRAVNRSYEAQGFLSALRVGADFNALSDARPSRPEVDRMFAEGGMREALQYLYGRFGDYGWKSQS